MLELVSQRFHGMKRFESRMVLGSGVVDEHGARIHDISSQMTELLVNRNVSFVLYLSMTSAERTLEDGISRGADEGQPGDVFKSALV
jgi:hypothetical protein